MKRLRYFAGSTEDVGRLWNPDNMLLFFLHNLWHICITLTIGTSPASPIGDVHPTSYIQALCDPAFSPKWVSFCTSATRNISVRPLYAEASRHHITITSLQGEASRPLCRRLPWWIEVSGLCECWLFPVVVHMLNSELIGQTQTAILEAKSQTFGSFHFVPFKLHFIFNHIT